jgi:hypothetical protein
MIEAEIGGSLVVIFFVKYETSIHAYEIASFLQQTLAGI